MEIIVVGRNAEIHPKFRQYVEEKVAKIAQYNSRTQRVDVELTHERNPRQADTAERIEITVYGKGPVIRAEASSSDRYAAVDIAAGKLYERLRRVRDRMKDHHRYDAPPLEGAEPDLPPVSPVAEKPVEAPAQEPLHLVLGEAVERQLGDSPVIVRQKLHEAEPMTVDQALYHMELVGHPFYLFIDEETRQPCVVYHRHGWTYGVIRLDATVTL